MDLQHDRDDRKQAADLCHSAAVKPCPGDIDGGDPVWIAVFLARSSDPLGGDGEYNLHLIAGGSEDEILQGDDRDGCYPCPLHAGKRRNGQSGQQHSVFCGIVRAVGSVGVSVRFQCGDKGPAVGPGWALTKKCRKITDTGCANYFFRLKLPWWFCSER